MEAMLSRVRKRPGCVYLDRRQANSYRDLPLSLIGSFKPVSPTGTTHLPRGLKLALRVRQDLPTCSKLLTTRRISLCHLNKTTQNEVL